MIPSGRVGEYVNEDFYEALGFYNDCCLFQDLGSGFPFRGGWADQPYPVYRILKLFLSESNRWERIEREQSNVGKGNFRA